MAKYIYVPGVNNSEFWKFNLYLEKFGKQISFRWSEPYAITTYVSPCGGQYEIWDNMDNSIPYSIEYIS